MKILIAISLLVTLTTAATTIAPTTKGLAGGRFDADVNSEGVKDAAAFAFQMISVSLNSAHALQMGKIEKAQSQVVSGVAYYLTLEIQETDCAKTVTDLSNCKIIKTEKCEAQVISRPWDTVHKKQLVSYQCQSPN